MNDLDSLVQQARAAFDAAPTAAELENAKARFLGKSGSLTELLKGLAALAPEAKKARGAEINQAKQQVEALLTAARERLAQAELEAQLRAEALDVTLPGRTRGTGGLHPVSRTIERIEDIFSSLGFEVAEGPEIETDWMSFTALNNPENHPARSMQDTFYVELKDAEGRWLNLRPHTSPMQVRYARAHAARHAGRAASGRHVPEVRVIAPGRVYRVDSDATHSPMFHQIEGLWLGEDVSFKDLKVTFATLVREFFETEDFDVRFRPSFFPFTEPSAEIDIRFGSGPLAGKWLEVAGSGQVHPAVVRNFGLDPEQHIGFAFGIGADRFAMLRYGIDDLRLMFDGDLRFLAQFR
ncbi:MAG: phenylalanine--tRNA ligase subunit alpha [Betaproteobacteria bacterium]